MNHKLSFVLPDPHGDMDPSTLLDALQAAAVGILGECGDYEYADREEVQEAVTDSCCVQEGE